MIDKIKFHAILNRRRELEQDCDEEITRTEECWKDLSDLLSMDISSSIEFMMSPECTQDDFSMISEVFDDIARNTQSTEFINCLKTLADRYPEDAEKYNYAGCISFAECALIEKKQHGNKH